MGEQKKFGAFAGVFTPSILTILGVIMYMRLGWVVGNAGLVGAIIIIVIAHVIAVTTGLSVSSVATDKKIGAGGIYYVLSRSMGIPTMATSTSFGEVAAGKRMKVPGPAKRGMSLPLSGWL